MSTERVFFRGLAGAGQKGHSRVHTGLRRLIPGSPSQFANGAVVINPLLPWRAAIIGAAVLAILPQVYAATTEQELLHDNPAGNYLAARHAGTERDSAAAAG